MYCFLYAAILIIETACQILRGRKMSPISGNEKMENIRNEYQLFYEHSSVGAILRSRATWFEQGGKSNEYFLNFETHKKDPRVLFVRSLPKTAFLPLIPKES